MIPDDPQERDVLAGEYVLGTLDGASRQEVEAALSRDADLQRRVLAWEERLLPLARAAVEPAATPADGWSRLAAAIGAGARQGPAGPRPSLALRAWRSVPLWRAATGLSAAAAILLAVLPARETGAGDRPTRFFAVLQVRDAAGGEAGPGWVIQVGEDGTVRSTPLGRVDPGEGRALQLWTLWDPARGPVSLGILPPGGAVRLPAERLPTIGGGQLFEITLEPSAGSPTGRPTGRILFIGRAAPAVSQTL